MIHFKTILFSMLTAWMTSWIVMALFMIIENINHPSRSIEESISILLMCGLGTLVVVAATWILLACPYYFLCIRRHRPARKVSHFLISSALAIGISGLMTHGDPESWPWLGLIAVLSALAGTLVLLRRNNQSPIINNQYLP